MLGNFSKGSRIAFYIPRYEYKRNDNSQNRPKIQSSEWIKTCKYFIESNEKLQQEIKENNSTPTIVNKEYLTNFLDNIIHGNDTNIVLYGNKNEKLPLNTENNFHISTVTGIVTEAFKIINNLSSSLENEGKKRLSLSLKYYSLISENEVFDLLNNNLEENYRIINIKKNISKDVNASFTSEIYERNWIDNVMDINVKSIDDILNVFNEGFEFFQKSKLINRIREKSYNTPKLIVSLNVKTSVKQNERSLIRKYEPLAVLNIIDFTTQKLDTSNDENNFEVKTIRNIISGLKRNLFYSPYLNPPYWSQTQYSPRDCQTLIVLFSEASPDSLDVELNDLLLSLNLFSDPKKQITDTNNCNTDLSENNENSNDDDIAKNDDNNNDKIDNETVKSKKKKNRRSITQTKTPEQIETLINNYQKQIKDYFDKDIAKSNYIERIEKELDNCKKMINSYSISDSFLRKKFLEMNYNMKMYKEQIDELEQMLHEKNNQISQQQQQIEQHNNDKSIEQSNEKQSEIEENESKSEVLYELNKKSENEELLEKEIKMLKYNEQYYIELLEDIELVKSFNNNGYETNKEIIEYYLTNLKNKIDTITQDLKSINILENTKVDDCSEDSISFNKNSSQIINDQSSIINNQNDNPISYEIYRLNEILKEKEKENCLLRNKIKKLERAPPPPPPPPPLPVYDKEENISDSRRSSQNMDDDIFAIQINRIKELEKNLRDVTSERDSNKSKISDLEFSLMKAQTLIISNTLNKKEEEKNKIKENGNNFNNNYNNNNNNSIDNNNKNYDPSSTSFYLSELSSFIPPSPPSISAFSPPTSPSSMNSDEESEPLYLTENIFPNLKKYKSKKNSKSRDKSNVKAKSSSSSNSKFEQKDNNKYADNYNYYNNNNNNLDLNLSTKSPTNTNNNNDYNISNVKPRLNNKSSRSGNRNTLYICDGLDNMCNNIDEKKSRQQIAEKLSSFRLDAPKKRDFEHRRANSIDCFNMNSNKYDFDLLSKNKNNGFTSYEETKTTKDTDSKNKSYQLSLNINETNKESLYPNIHDEFECKNEKEAQNENNHDYFSTVTGSTENSSLIKDKNDEKDTYVKLPQMVVEYDKSRITIKNEEVEKLIPLNYILNENKRGRSRHASHSSSSRSSYSCDNHSHISSSSKSPHINNINNITKIRSPSLSSSHKSNMSNSKHKNSSSIKINHEYPDSYINQSNTTIKASSHHNNSILSSNSKNKIRKSNKSNIDKNSTINCKNDNMDDMMMNTKNITINSNRNANVNPNLTAPIITNTNILNNDLNNKRSNYSLNNYSNYNNYNNYDSPTNSSTISNKYNDKYKSSRSKVKSSNISRLTPTSINSNSAINELNEKQYQNQYQNKNENPVQNQIQNHISIQNQNSLIHDNNMILNKEVLDELRMNSSHEIIEAESSNSDISENENDDEEIDSEEETTSETESTTYSSDEDDNDSDNDESYSEESEKKEYPSYIIKQNDSAKFVFNEPYNMNQYDLSHSDSIEYNSPNNSVKKNNVKSNYMNENSYPSPNNDSFMDKNNLNHSSNKSISGFANNNNKSKRNSMYYLNNSSNHNISNINYNENVKKTGINNYGSNHNSPNNNYDSNHSSPNNANRNNASFIKSPKLNYNSINLNQSHIIKNSGNYESSIMKNYNNSITINNIPTNSIYNYNMSFSQQQNSYNPLSSLTYINNSGNYNNTLNNSSNANSILNNTINKNNINYDNSDVNYLGNMKSKSNSEVNKTQKDKKRKIPVENKKKNINENMVKIPPKDPQNMNSNINNGISSNEKLYYKMNNSKSNIGHSSMNISKSIIKHYNNNEEETINYDDNNNYKSYNSNKENYNNSNFNHSTKETKERKKEKEETSNIYKLSHRISKIFSSKKNSSSNNSSNNLSKRLSHVSIDSLQSEKNNGRSGFFSQNFFHNDQKRNSLAVTDSSRINYMGASDPYNILGKEKLSNQSKKSHKHMLNCIPKKNIILS